MYLGIDIGGTKTLAAVLDENANIVEQTKFPTSQNYDEFIADMSKIVAAFTTKSFKAAVAGVPGLVIRETGYVHSLGNLPWRDKPIRNDIANALNGTVVIIENDSKLAGLSEAQLIPEYQNMLYLTFSTGINGALVLGGQLVKELQDSEMGKIPLLHDGQYVHWEDFAGGRSIVERFHKKAKEITDPSEWQQVAETFSQGLAPLVSVLQPEVVVLGGGVGAYTDHFSSYLMDFLHEHLHANVRPPKAVVAAKRPNEAVIYGCYDLAKQTYGSAA